MSLTLRRLRSHVHVTDSYRVVFDGVEIGSIGVQNGVGMERFWAWGIDTVLPRQDFATDGKGRDIEDCKRQFKDAWYKLSRNPERLAEFMTAKRDAQRQWRR